MLRTSAGNNLASRQYVASHEVYLHNLQQAILLDSGVTYERNGPGVHVLRLGITISHNINIMCRFKCPVGVLTLLPSLSLAFLSLSFCSAFSTFLSRSLIFTWVEARTARASSISGITSGDQDASLCVVADDEACRESREKTRNGETKPGREPTSALKMYVNELSYFGPNTMVRSVRKAADNTEVWSFESRGKFSEDVI